MAAPPPARDATTTTVALNSCSGYDRADGMAIDADGSIYYTEPYPGFCVYKSHRRRCGRHAPPIVLAGDPEEKGEADGAAHSARFRSPGGVCLNPLDPRSLLVTDCNRVRAVDTATGDVTTLAVTGHKLVHLESCASGGGYHVWLVDSGTSWAPDDLRCSLTGTEGWLLRLDVRSMVVERILPLALNACASTITATPFVLCVDNNGNAICRSEGKPRLLRVRPDGTTTLLASASQFGGSSFSDFVHAAAAGDGSIVVSEYSSSRLWLVSPGGTVSALAGSGEYGAEDGPPAEAEFGGLGHVAVSPQGDVLVLDSQRITWDEERWRILLRTVPVRLQPPPHLAPPPALLHPGAALTTSLLQTGLLADLTIRVATGKSGEGRQRRRQQHTGRQAATAGGGGTGRCGDGGSCSSAAAVEAEDEVDIPCHRAIMATASPYFLALCDGSLARQQRDALLLHLATSGSTAGRKRKAAGGEASSGEAGASDAVAAAAALPVPVVVTVDDASADAVRAVLRHVYTGDLGGVNAATAQDVLHLAQLWGLDGLLAAAQAHVVEQLLGPGNAAEWLVCAHLRQYGAIRAAALRAVVDRFPAVRGDAAQAALLQAHPGLLMEAMALACGAT